MKQAQKIVVEQLRESGELDGEPRPITHPVKFYERATARSRSSRRGSGTSATAAAIPSCAPSCSRLGRELHWHPPHMRARYDTWIDGLNSDWLVSRQRYFGVPFPVWYRVDADGDADLRRPDRCPPRPTCPSTRRPTCPPGFTADQRGQPGGFTADPDVMDTWATSSLTPQIVTGWVDDPDLFARTFPMDLRPQGPEIIRTWLFDTVVRARFEHGALPWTDTTINGWVLDPDRKKMSKSKGNVVTPMPLVEEYGADALRYWACNGRPGGRHRGRLRDHEDRPQARDQDPQRVEVHAQHRARRRRRHGRRRSRARSRPRSTGRCSRALADLVDDATAAFDAFDYARALERTERFFWSFCDDYVELVKGRAYGGAGDADGARRPRSRCAPRCRRCCALFAPFLPFVTEEVWSWLRDGFDPPRAVARRPRSLRLAGGDPLVFEVAAEVLAAVRKAKSEQKVSLMTPVDQVVVHDTAERLAALDAAPRPTCATRARSPSSRPRSAPSCGSRSSSRRPTAREPPRRLRRRGPGSTPHVNLETASACRRRTRERGAPTLERISTLLQYLGSPAARVPGDPPHRHERQDHDDADAHRAARRRVGLTVGAYTSPHLERVNERIVDRRRADRRRRARRACSTRSSRSSSSRVGVDPSYFEVVTAAAFRWFADDAVDVAVVEVGLGGTWDATNVVDARRRGRHEREHRPRRVSRRHVASRSRPRRPAS